MHDFRENFGIPDPYKIPFTANYKYLGQRAWKGKNYPAFSVSYKIQAQPPAVRGKIYPRKIQGSSDQVVYWDSAFGQIAAYSEDFRYTFELSNSRKVEWRGKAQAGVLGAQRMGKEKIVEEIVQVGIADVNVEIVEEGIRLTLDDIQFYPDSPKMLPGEERKLDQIIDLLMKYKDRDIMVAGHTALVGTSGHLELSTARAATVAEYLISKGVRTADRVVVRGYGADRPVADNKTEEGRRKNRRVEITILEN
jgi:outer membrane protein OmpA-like peptidoglycan-associated protein